MNASLKTINSQFTKIVVLVSLIFFTQKNFAFGQTSKPNIIFILADDLGYGDLGCFGSNIIKTPHIDQLASKGIKLTQFYSGSTVCAPSRAALMTGRHTGQGYIRGNGEIPLRKQDIILPQLLKKAGYTTGMFGKWGLGDINTSGSPVNKGWDEFFGFLHHIEAHYQAPAMAWHYKTGMNNVERSNTSFGGFAADEITNRCVKFIADQPTDKPFFVYLSLPLPHAELYAPKEAMKQYQDKDGHSIFNEKPYDGSHYGGQNQPKAAYAAMVSKIDDYVGKIVETLDKKGLSQNTLIVFTSDNGTHIEGGRTMQDVDFMNSCGGLKGVKRSLTEGGIRVPTIVSGLNLPAKTVRPGYGAFWDFLPTFLALANAPKVKNIDGQSQWEYWKTGKNWQEKPLYWEFFEGGYFQAVRSGDWKYIHSKTANSNMKDELYNLKDDPAESTNLAEKNKVQLDKMKDLVTQLHTKADHPLFLLPSEK